MKVYSVSPNHVLSPMSYMQTRGVPLESDSTKHTYEICTYGAQALEPGCSTSNIQQSSTTSLQVLS